MKGAFEFSRNEVAAALGMLLVEQRPDLRGRKISVDYVTKDGTSDGESIKAVLTLSDESTPSTPGWDRPTGI